MIMIDLINNVIIYHLIKNAKYTMILNDEFIQ